MRVLVTNDDGFDAPGLAAIANALVEAGHEVLVAAPLQQQSGGSAALGRVIHGAAIDWREFSMPAMPGIALGLAIDAPPALAVKTILCGNFGPPPEIVISGINPGWNTGPPTLHSGTLGAAVAACAMGWRAAALSCGRPPHGNMQTAAQVGVAIVALLADWTEPVALNVNVPNLPLDRILGVRRVPVGPVGLLDVDVVRDGAQLRYRVFPCEPDPASECDARTVQNGFVAVSVLAGGYGDRVPRPGFEAALTGCLQRSGT